MDPEKLVQEEKAKAAQAQASEEAKEKDFRRFLDTEYATQLAMSVADPAACAAQASASLMVRRHVGYDLVSALEKFIKAEEALEQKEAFYLLGTDPTTQLPYINGKNEAIRDAQLVVFTKTEREASQAAEIQLARAEVQEDIVTDDMDWRVAVLYVHAAHGFPERKLPEAKAEVPPGAQRKAAAAEAPQPEPQQ